MKESMIEDIKINDDEAEKWLERLLYNLKKREDQFN